MRWVGENSMPSFAASPSSPGVERNAEQGRPRDAGDAVRAAGQALPVDDDEADDLAERQRDDGEIVAAQPQHGKAEHHAPECGEDAGERQADPERQPEIGRQQRVGIGADRVERDIAEVEQAGEADHHVQSPAQHHIGQHEDAEIEDVALIVEDHRHQEGEDQEQRRDRRGAPAPARFATCGGTILTVPTGPHHCRSSSIDDAAAEHRGDHGGEIAEPGPVDQLPGRSGFGADADHQRKQHQRHQRADQRLS